MGFGTWAGTGRGCFREPGAGQIFLLLFVVTQLRRNVPCTSCNLFFR